MLRPHDPPSFQPQDCKIDPIAFCTHTAKSSFLHDLPELRRRGRNDAGHVALCAERHDFRREQAGWSPGLVGLLLIASFAEDIFQGPHLLRFIHEQSDGGSQIAPGLFHIMTTARHIQIRTIGHAGFAFLKEDGVIRWGIMFLSVLSCLKAQAPLNRRQPQRRTFWTFQDNLLDLE